jgi:3-oxoadipate enol-lactonase
LRSRMEMLMDDGLAPGLASLPEQVAVADRTLLANVGVPVLVIGSHGDELHPASVAEDLAAILPNATLHLYDKPGVLWTQRADVRERIATFLNQ